MIPAEVLKEVLKLMAKYGIKKENMLADYPTLKWLFLSDRIPTIVTGRPVEITPVCVNLEDHEIVKSIKKYVNKTLSNIPENCCYTHDDQREPLEEIQKILDGNKKWDE